MRGDRTKGSDIMRVRTLAAVAQLGLIALLVQGAPVMAAEDLQKGLSSVEAIVKDFG